MAIDLNDEVVAAGADGPVISARDVRVWYGTTRGAIRAVDVIGPATAPTAQGIAPGEFAELLAAIRADTTYVNVHSSLYPGGEIRSQLESHHH